MLRLFTHRELANQIHPVKHVMSGGYVNSSALPLGSPEIHYAGQIIALVVAQTQEASHDVAQNVNVRYREQPSTGILNQPGTETELFSAVKPDHKDPSLGAAEQAFSDAQIKVDATYQNPIQHHNPMELFGTTCVWSGDRLHSV